MEFGGLVGRSTELGLCNDLVGRLVAGRGGVILVEGEPGIGKTALVDAGIAHASRVGCSVARAAGDELVRRFPLRVLLDALEVESSSADSRRAAVADALRGGQSGRLTAAGDPMAAAAEGLLALVERLCAEAPLVLAVDDLQWADGASLVLWRRLAQLTEQVPLLLVGAFRPVPRRDEMDAVRLAARAFGHTIMLGPLPEADAVQLVARLLAADPGPRLRGLVAQAAGNPLWLGEIADAVRRDHTVAVHSGTAEVELAGVEMPTSLTAAVSRRLTFLSPPATEVMRTAALLGLEFSVTHVATVLGRQPSQLMDEFDEATAAGVVGETADRLAFRHPLIRQALYDDMPTPLRAGLHRHAGRALGDASAPVSAVAAQLIAGGGADHWLVDWLARHAPVLINQSLEVGVELLRRAVEFGADTSGDPAAAGVAEELAALLAQALLRIGSTDEALLRARQVLARTCDPDRAAEMREILTDLLLRGQQVEEALTTVRDGLDSPGVSPKRRARLLAQYAAVQMSGMSDLDGGEATAQQAAELGVAANDRYAVGSALLRLAGVSAYRGDLTAMHEYTERGLAAVGDDPDCLRIRVLLNYNHVFALQALDRMAEAEQVLRAARDLAERMGGGTVQRAYTLVAMHAYGVGRWDDALAGLEVVADPAADDVLALLARGVAARIAGHRDERERAMAQLAAIADIEISNPSLRNNSDFALAARALAAEQSGDQAGALGILAVVLQPEFAVMDNRFRLLADVVRLALAVGERSVAEAAVATVEADAARAPTPALWAAVGRCRGLLVGDAAPVLAAADHYRSCGRVVDLAQSLEDVAVLLATAGNLEPARSALREAAAIYTDLGAVWDLRRADARLRPSGVRRGARGPRQRPKHGFGALSPTELTVARLVATGRSNPDIAAELLLSRRTVQSHVSHILAKLGAHSRVEIARHVADQSTEPAH